MGRSLECFHFLFVVVRHDDGVVCCDEPIACAYLIFLRCRNEASVIEPRNFLFAYFLPFLHQFAQFSVKKCKTQSKEGLDHSLAIIM